LLTALETRRAQKEKTIAREGRRRGEGRCYIGKRREDTPHHNPVFFGGFGFWCGGDSRGALWLQGQSKGKENRTKCEGKKKKTRSSDTGKQ